MKQTMTINETVDNYTYITMTDERYKVSADYIITQYNDDDDISYSAECDGIDGFDNDYIVMCHTDIYSADGFDTMDQAMADVIYHFYRLVKNYNEGWLNI